MDVFGAFQLCCIGILAAPVTVTLSRTYFQIRGRNTIFLWAGLILAGESTTDHICEMLFLIACVISRRPLELDNRVLQDKHNQVLVR